MRKDILVFPDACDRKPRRAEERSRVILSVGAERFAIDISASITEMASVEAQILPFECGGRRQKRKARSLSTSD